jgi:hypothetical protein
MLTHQLGEAPVSFLGASEGDQSRGVAVETVDDAGTLWIATRDQARERVDECPTCVSGPRMDDERGRLVDHEQMLVLPNDPGCGRWRR